MSADSRATPKGCERPHHRQTTSQQPFARDRPAELSEEQRVGLRLDVVGDEARALFRSDPARHGNRARVISVGGVQECEDGARVPEDAASHWSRIACLSRAPGRRLPLRPAPTNRNIAWSRRKGGICCFCFRRASGWRADDGTRRRPPRRMLGSSPRRINRQIVDRDTPSARPASTI